MWVSLIFRRVFFGIKYTEFPLHFTLTEAWNKYAPNPSVFQDNNWKQFVFFHVFNSLSIVTSMIWTTLQWVCLTSWCLVFESIFRHFFIPGLFDLWPNRAQKFNIFQPIAVRKHCFSTKEVAMSHCLPHAVHQHWPFPSSIPFHLFGQYVWTLDSRVTWGDCFD